ncbi:ubiquinone biosynthesis O-methyltransferase [Aliidongia dinghuensis]|uniref:Ubiquinone biosynthesis O-methyltransferase n=1 Tax=Aliidongia dinghuensis TaxID=1867774 RepID=A0A8J2YPG4_9PROT|nr:bifunctional 2-polyprenyl-6-hydroxyphenol methylase/3-demethylubiquinol 3-O-methyltransferase UbiG [Aliidongia dinghuensis]GGF00165.1 ubiquinone biosynthesis O-methyltransferase [Aliidongia dinghuensis]
MTSSASSSVDPDEVARFAAIAEAWWDPNGKFRPLHKFNPTRLAYVRDRLAAHFGRDVTHRAPFQGLRLLDIGCGGGLVAEPMARLGFAVTGVDATERNIAVASAHAAEQELAIDYRFATAEDLVAQGMSFDAVLALEVIEHVADPEAFLLSVGRLVKPGGLVVVATLNRTAKAFGLAILGAEYVLGWLPRGTHTWSKFLKPSEVAAGLRHAGLTLQDLTGVTYNPLADKWHLGPDTSVNYLMTAVKIG